MEKSRMKVQLIARVRVQEGDTHYPQVAPAFHANGKIKAGYAIIKGEEVRVAQVMNYYMRFSLFVAALAKATSDELTHISILI
jgi:hypothetical protein